MKKTLSYIVVMIALCGLCTPTSHARAQEEPPLPQDTSYQLLQPLPCDDRTTIGNGFGPGCEDDMLKSVDPAETSAFVDYLNFGIRLFIGLCAVLGVVMFTVGGVEYATSELISGKAAGKERMLGAGFGIVLAFGSYTLLFQINPDLLRGDVRIEGVVLNVLVEEFDIEPARREDGPLLPRDNNGLKACNIGLVQTRNGKKMCATVAGKFDEMIDAAKQAGIAITPSGFRSREEQAALRIKYCNGDLYNPQAKCSRTVAPVGSSRHENGLAFDILRCNNKPSTCSDACYNWMRNNGGNFGFYNKIYPRTNDCVHWSVDGN